MATHSSILASRIPWTEEPGRLQSLGSRVRHDCSDLASTHTCVILEQGSNATKLKLIGFAFIFNLENMKTRVWGKQSHKRHLGNFSSVRGCRILNWRWNVLTWMFRKKQHREARGTKDSLWKLELKCSVFPQKSLKAFHPPKEENPQKNHSHGVQEHSVVLSPTETTSLGSDDVKGNPGSLGI